MKARTLLIGCLASVVGVGSLLTSLAVIGLAFGDTSVANSAKADEVAAPLPNPAKPPAAPVEREPDTAPRRIVYSKNVTVQIGLTSYTVWDAWWRSIPNRRFLFIEITARNDDTDVREVPPFMLVDADGTKYRRSVAEVRNAFPVDLELNPGVSRRGILVFEVPQDRSYTLEAHDGAYRTIEPALFEVVTDK